jgi:cytochrome P450
VTVSAAGDIYFDPYDVELNADPYPMFRRLRQNAPLYYNEQHDFYALSRFDDVDRAIVDHQAFSSAKGAILEIIKANIAIPPGVLIFEDPPIRDIHRKLLSRMFTPRKINDLESKIREFCARSLDPLIGTDRFHFVADLGAQMPMRVIGMLLGFPIPAGRGRFRYPARGAPTSDVQCRHPLLPQLGASPPRGPDSARGDLAALPRMGRRPYQRQAIPDVHRAGLGDNAGRSELSHVRK